MNLMKRSKLGHNEKLSGKNVNYEPIVDSGASHHMTGCLSLLTNVQDIVPIPVELPLDIETFADHVTRTMIGTGKEQGGVFLFKETEQGYENWVKVDDDFELWHRRLGHPSENKVLLLASKY
ncbi:retrovirus-related pol polyprotein from transposon TNT 1-94 [Tanacetum coccineum]